MPSNDVISNLPPRGSEARCSREPRFQRGAYSALQRMPIAWPCPCSFERPRRAVATAIAQDVRPCFV